MNLLVGIPGISQVENNFKWMYLDIFLQTQIVVGKQANEMQCYPTDQERVLQNEPTSGDTWYLPGWK